METEERIRGEGVPGGHVSEFKFIYDFRVGRLILLNIPNDSTRVDRKNASVYRTLKNSVESWCHV